MSVAASYEIIEWLYAVIEGGNAGVEFLGSQGDIWDAQKDMLADTMGALTALVIFLFVRPDKNLSSRNAYQARLEHNLEIKKHSINTMLKPVKTI